MCLAFSLVSFTSEDVGTRLVGVMPTVILPQQANLIGGVSTLKWMIEDNCLATYHVRVVQQAEDPADLFRVQRQWLSSLALSVSADQGVRLNEVHGATPRKKKKLDNNSDAAHSAISFVNAGTALVLNTSQKTELRRRSRSGSVSRHLSCLQDSRWDTLVGNMISFLAQQAPKDVCNFVRNLVSVLKSQGHVSEQWQDIGAACEAVASKAGAVQNVKSPRRKKIMQLNDLPDEMLLKVFAFLSPDDLLRSVRPLNRRYRRLALDSNLWKHCGYSLENMDTDQLYDWRSLRLALRLAPCLHTLELDPNHHPTTEFDEDDATYLKEDIQSVMRLMEETDCAIGHICLKITGCIGAGWAASMLRWQASLGRLRSVNVAFFHDSLVPQSDVSRVLLFLQSSDLDEMSISNYAEGALAPCGSPKPTEGQRLLKRLSYVCRHTVGEEVEPLLEHLLALHGPSLEHVNLHSYALAVPLLPRYCPNLREASVPASCDLEPLLQCSSLTSLRLHVEEFPSPETITYLFHAVGLTSVEIVLEDRGYPPQWDAIIEALASSGESQLERLSIDESLLLEDSYTPYHFLETPLAGLPRLQILELDNVFDGEELEAISPTSAPSLRVLHYSRQAEPCCNDQTVCFLSGVRRLLRRNPLLHVTGLLAAHCCTAWGSCACCLGGEHSGRAGRSALPSGFFAHDASHRCSLHVNSYEWVRMGGRGRCDSGVEGDDECKDADDDTAAEEESASSEFEETDVEDEESEFEEEERSVRARVSKAEESD